MSSALHALTEKVVLVDTDEFYLVEDPYTTGHDRRTSLANLKAHFAKNIVAAGTLTASSPAGVSQTWNNSAATFAGFSIDITDLGSAVGSTPFRVQVGGTPIFSVRVNGDVITSRDVSVGSLLFIGGSDTILLRDAAAGVLAQRNSTNAQVFRVYRTITDISNYERQVLQSGAGYFEWAAETAGTGVDNIDLRLTPAGTGRVSLFSDGVIFGNSSGLILTSASEVWYFPATGMVSPGGNIIGWSSNLTDGSAAAADTGLARNAAGIVEVNNGTPGTLRDLRARSFTADTAFGFAFASQGSIASPANGVFTLFNATATGFDRLQFGGSTSSFPALKRSSIALQIRLADDSGFAPLHLGATSASLQVGTHTAIGAETVTGYITIKDSGGTDRKIAVVS